LKHLWMSTILLPCNFIHYVFSFLINKS
jgi:hypothetical protein